ncbi:hypothetical protein WJR50_33165 [Catalinimonas sp. 4WD22]|uniref:hypothetical protein n=1 Tax=Catalinimonas locisalis TaxID=3133978 RepID=UPI003100FD37
MHLKFRFFTLLFILPFALRAQLIMVYDSKALGKSVQDFAMNVVKQQQYQKTLQHSESMLTQYSSIEALQKEVLHQWKQAESVRDLHWSDLTKSIYLADELVNGISQSDIEIDIIIGEHPVLNRSIDETYADLFMASSAEALAVDFNNFQEDSKSSDELISSFSYYAAQRITYAAVAFQYLADDFIRKASEMNEVLKQADRFSMTEAERIALQAYSEEYLLTAETMLERSDEFLLQVTKDPEAINDAVRQRKSLERTLISDTSIF